MNLGDALQKQGYELKLVRVPWAELGWAGALRWLWRVSGGYSGPWTLVQYTALAWSRHGFSLGFLAVLGALKKRRTRVGVVFHDSQLYAGQRLVDRLRRVCQRFVMRCAYLLSDVAIVNIPVERVGWLPERPCDAAFIPVGANLPAISTAAKSARNGHEAKTIAVFTVTDGGDISKEVSDIACAAKAAAERVPRVRLVTLGRGSRESEPWFRQALEGTTVEYSALGVLPAEEVSRVLSNADVSLFVRGPISTQRSSAIASIACGLPLVAYADRGLPAPLAEAGVVAVRRGDPQALGEAAVTVLTNQQLWLELRQRSQRAYEKYFSWEAVAGRILEALNNA
jgi:glycosyltransferase involved in cell wall biosynthesis